MIVFGIFLFPISEHSFYLHAARLLYLAKTDDATVFKEAENKVGNEKYLDPQSFPKSLNDSEKRQIKTHRPIVLSAYDNVMLFTSRLLGTLFCCDSCWKKRGKLEKMYDLTEERITKELDIVRVMKSVNDSKQVMAASLIDRDTKFQIAHSYKNVLDLDRTDSD